MIVNSVNVKCEGIINCFVSIHTSDGSVRSFSAIDGGFTDDDTGDYPTAMENAFLELCREAGILCLNLHQLDEYEDGIECEFDSGLRCRSYSIQKGA